MGYITKEALTIVIDKAVRIFKEIRRKYVALSGYLVLSSPYGQCLLTNDGMKILAEFSDMVFDSSNKQEVLTLIEYIRSLEADQKAGNPPSAKRDASPRIDKARQDLESALGLLEFKDDTFVEIRFDGSPLDLIFELQKDPLASQKHTPQTHASIRIVLGTVRELHEKSIHGDGAGE